MQWKRRIIAKALVAASLVAASAARAAEIGPCNALDRVSLLVGQMRTFAQGKIRLAHVDTDGEPVCCSSHLLVIIPAPELGSQCFAVSQTAAKGEASATGFSSIAIERVRASYDARRGTLLSVPYRLYNADGGNSRPAVLNLRIDLRGSGSVTIER